MSDDRDAPKPAQEPSEVQSRVEITVPLVSVEMTSEARYRFLNRLYLNRSMKGQPLPKRTITISSPAEPDFFIVEEFGKD